MSSLSSGWPLQLLEAVNILSAAALGAGFFSLMAAHRYVRDRTFEPRYNQLYVVRFVLGITAGVILAVGLGQRFFADFGVGLLAIVGGYAADAVAEILQRVADTLLTIVKGSDASASDAERRGERATLEAQRVRERTEAKEPLFQARAEALAQATPQRVREQIDRAIEALD